MFVYFNIEHYNIYIYSLCIYIYTRFHTILTKINWRWIMTCLPSHRMMRSELSTLGGRSPGRSILGCKGWVRTKGFPITNSPCFTPSFTIFFQGFSHFFLANTMNLTYPTLQVKHFQPANGWIFLTFWSKFRSRKMKKILDATTG